MNPWVRGESALQKGKLTILSGRFIGTSAHAGASFVCTECRQAKVLMCRSEAKFCTCIAEGIQMHVFKKVINSLQFNTAATRTASQTNCYYCVIT